MAHEVFISYSVDDKPIADQMCVTLESNGLTCWMAPRDILPGMDWGGSIIEAIATSRVMVLLLSSNSNTSPQVRREVERAVNKEVIVIPFRIEDVRLSSSLEYQLSSTQWMDAITPPLEDHLQTLAERIKHLLSTDSSEKRPVQKKDRPPVKPVPPPVKPVPPFDRRRAVYIGAAVVIGLVVLVGLALWLGPKMSKPEPTETVATHNTPTPLPTPTLRTDQSNAQEKATPNQSPSPVTSPSNPSGQLTVPKIYGKTYALARKLLLKEGWQPNERHISHGNDPEVELGNGPIFWKRGYRELDTCSGSGLAECLFEFIDPTGRVLVVVTQGEEDENGAYHATVKRTVFKSK